MADSIRAAQYETLRSNMDSLGVWYTDVFLGNSEEEARNYLESLIRHTKIKWARHLADEALEEDPDFNIQNHMPDAARSKNNSIASTNQLLRRMKDDAITYDDIFADMPFDEKAKRIARLNANSRYRKEVDAFFSSSESPEVRDFYSRTKVDSDNPNVSLIRYYREHAGIKKTLASTLCDVMEYFQAFGSTKGTIYDMVCVDGGDDQRLPPDDSVGFSPSRSSRGI